MTSFQFFGPAHLCILAAVPLFAAVLTFVQRRLPPGSKILRVSLGTILLLDSAVYYFTLAAYGQLTIPDHLPLELCDASLCLVIVALFTLNEFVYDLAYYGALAGATMALLTPNVTGPFSSFWTVQFFIDHGLIVAGALYLVWSGQARPRKDSVPRAMLWPEFLRSVCRHIQLVLQDKLYVSPRQAAKRIAAQFSRTLALVYSGRRRSGAGCLRVALSSVSEIVSTNSNTM